MWSIVLVILAVLLGIIGIIGSIVPAIPGPPISWVGLLLAFLSHRMGGADMSLSFVLIWLGVTVAVTVLDFIVPSRFTRMAGGTKAGSTGATIGMIIGMLFTPIGMIPCSLIGAFEAEWVQEKKSAADAFKSALGTFLGFLVGTGLKLTASCFMMFHILV